jgi:ketosteroid isomerase-like protein
MLSKIFFLAFLTFFCTIQPGLCAGHDNSSDDKQKITAVLHAYEQAINNGKIDLASQIWLQSDESTIIHPRGHEHGWEAIKNNFYTGTMFKLFSKRKLVLKDINMHVHGDSAWLEMYWDFWATTREGKDLHHQGRETQVLRKIHDHWRIVHIHYSNIPKNKE